MILNYYFYEEVQGFEDFLAGFKILNKSCKLWVFIGKNSAIFSLK